MLDFFKIINIDLPSNLKAFMIFFSDGIFDYFPNFLYSEKAEKLCEINWKLLENDIKCIGLNNIGNHVL